MLATRGKSSLEALEERDARLVHRRGRGLLLVARALVPLPLGGLLARARNRLAAPLSLLDDASVQLLVRVGLRLVDARGGAAGTRALRRALGSLVRGTAPGAGD